MGGAKPNNIYYIEHHFQKLEAPKSISWAVIFSPGCQPGRKMLRLVAAQPPGLTARARAAARAATRHAPVDLRFVVRRIISEW